MSTRINHNINSMIAQTHVLTISRLVRKNIERLSSGLRINRASDDAAGLSISEELRAQIRGSRQARSNTEDGISLIQIAEGALNEVESIVQRMRELAIQSASDTLTATERSFTTNEYRSLIAEINRIGNVTQFNSQALLDGTYNGKIFHVGPNNSTLDGISVSIGSAILTDMNGGGSGAGTGVGGSTLSSNIASNAVIGSLDTMISYINNRRSDLGAIVNRLEHTVTNLANQEHNMQAAESQIRDVDFAFETAQFTRNQILTQSATAMLVQSNAVPQNVLALLQ